MSNDRIPPRKSRGSDDEEYRNAYLKALNPNRTSPRSGDTSQDDVSGRSGTRAKSRGRIYEEGDEQPQRPRSTRQSREEVEARLRQRPRQPVYSRNQQEEPRRKKDEPVSRSTPRREEMDEYPYEQPRSRARNTPRPRDDDYERESVTPRRRRSGRGKRAAKNVMVGCIGGVLTLAALAGVIAYILLTKTPLGQDLNKLKYTRQNQQVLTIGNATQLIVRNMVGNITIRIDSKATDATLTSTKNAIAGSQEEANTIFNSITLTSKQISQEDDPDCLVSTCVLVTGSVPTAQGGVLGAGNGNTIDLTINLPNSFANPDDPSTLSANVTTGNIAVSGFNGILDLSSNSSGNISVSNALIYAGTCLQTTSGNINVDRNSIFNLTKPSDRIPCTNKTSSAGDQFWFHILSGKGNVDLTLPAPDSALWANTNLFLDILTNQGAITNDFGLEASTEANGSASYEGLLIPNNKNTPAKLYLKASTGNITIHKK